MSLLFPTSGHHYPVSRSAPARAATVRQGPRFRWPLIAGLAVNLVLWAGIITAARALIG